MAKPLASIRVTERAPRLLRDGRAACGEVWSAVTVDGAWRIERTEDPGTPWMLTRLADGQSAGQVGTLRYAQEIIASGVAETRARMRRAGQRAYDAAHGLSASDRDAARWSAESEELARIQQAVAA